MAAFSDYLSNRILNLVLGATSFTPPATIYAAAMTANPTDAGGGTEVTGGGYARIALTNNTSVFPTTTTQLKNLASSAQFPEATANWGTVTSIAYYDASSAGNLLFWYTIPSQIINSGDTLRIPAGTAGLNVTLD